MNNKKQNDVNIFVNDKFIINDISPIKSNWNTKNQIILSFYSAPLYVNHNISFELGGILKCSILTNEKNNFMHKINK